MPDAALINRMAKTIYSFGSPCNAHFGNLVLRRDGSLFGYAHPNEKCWRLEGRELVFDSSQGRVTSRYAYVPGTGQWLGHLEGKRAPLHLLPILSLDGQETGAPGMPAIVVNSIPKSGTYFLDAALTAVGCPSIRMHLNWNQTVDDYRGVADADMHTDPETLRLRLGVELVAAVLDGQHVVGHIEEQELVERMRGLGVCVLTLVRDLREVVPSLYRFKRTRVAPCDVGDAFWRGLDEPERTAAFLMYHHERDMEHIRTMARMILADKEALVLRYEDLCRGILTPQVAARLDGFLPGLAARLSDALGRHYKKPNPTYTGAICRWREEFTPTMARYFKATGMDAINKDLGYGAT